MFWLRALEDVQWGKPVVVLVHGGSGIGKTALVQHFLQEVEQQFNTVVFSGRCYEHELVPYKAMDSLIDSLSRYLNRLPPLEVAGILPRNVLPLVRVFPVLSKITAIAGLAQRAQGLEIPDPQELRRRAFAGLRDLLARLGDRQHLVLCIDDLQWGDVDSAALLTELLRPPDPPLFLFVGCYRSEDVQKSVFLSTLTQFQDKSDNTIDWRDLPVEPLSQHEACQLALGLLAENSPETQSQAEVIGQESAGNPLFVYELVQQVQAVASRGRASAQKLALDEVLWNRVLQLPDHARRLLEALAVAGQPLEASLAAQVGDVGDDYRDLLALLRSQRFVRVTGLTEQEEIETYHDRIRETVVEHLSREQLKRHHLRIAETLEQAGRIDPERLAVHLEGAGEHQRAGECYGLAAVQAAAALAFDRAATLYRRAIDLHPGDYGQEHRLRVALAESLANAGCGAEAAQEYLAAAAHANPAEALELRRLATEQFLYTGHTHEGLSALGEVLAAVGMSLPATPRRALWSLILRRAQLRLRGLRFHTRDPSQIARKDLLRFHICSSAKRGLSLVDPIRAADFQTRSLLLALRCGEPSQIATSLTFEAMHTAAQGIQTQQRVERLLEKAETLAREVKDPAVSGLIAMARGVAGNMYGCWKRGVEYSGQAERIFRERCTGVAFEINTAQGFALWALNFAGEVGELAHRIPPYLAEAEKQGNISASAHASTLVLPALAADNPSGAERELRRWADYLHQNFSQHYNAFCAQIQIDLYRGDAATAWKHFQNTGRQSKALYCCERSWDGF